MSFSKAMNVLRRSVTLFTSLAVSALVSSPLLSADSNPDFNLLELRVYENRIDGCTDCGCRLNAYLKEGENTQFWVTFGQIRPDENSGWVSEGSYSYCGTGPFERASDELRNTTGVPFLVTDVTVNVARSRKQGLILNARMHRALLSGFDRRKRAEYAESTENFELNNADGQELVLPLLLEIPEDSTGFGNHELLLGLTTLSLVPEGKLGSITVKGDVPGARVYLDGGLASHIGPDGTVTMQNVVTGQHEVAVSDFSERRKVSTVKVREGTESNLEFQLLEISTSQPDSGLANIGTNPQGAREFWRPIDEVVMVEIPAGPFLMGSPEGVGDEDERPQREVDLPAFLIDKHEVTNRQFLKFTRAERRPSTRTPAWGKPDNYPVTFVLWDEADDYCRWAGGRLPTEAEWEKAARGEEGLIYPWGNEWDATRCNTLAGGMHRPQAVGSFPGCLSPYGVLDMSGSAAEWTADWYTPYEAPESSQDMFSTAPRLKVLRGGGWIHSSQWVRTAYRHERIPTSPNMDHGFRCAYDAEGASP